MLKALQLTTAERSKGFPLEKIMLSLSGELFPMTVYSKREGGEGEGERFDKGGADLASPRPRTIQNLSVWPLSNDRK